MLVRQGQLKRLIQKNITSELDNEDHNQGGQKKAKYKVRSDKEF